MILPIKRNKENNKESGTTTNLTLAGLTSKINPKKRKKPKAVMPINKKRRTKSKIREKERRRIPATVRLCSCNCELLAGVCVCFVAGAAALNSFC